MRLRFGSLPEPMLDFWEEGGEREEKEKAGKVIGDGRE